MTADDFSSRMDRSSALPLWAQLHADLVRRIAAGEFAEGFPGEHALTTSYGLSRHTVREALRRLRHDGALVAERGRATRLADVPAIEQPARCALQLVSRSRGEWRDPAQHRARTRASHRSCCCSHLGLDPDAPLVYLERLRMADDLPLALDSVWLPADVAEPLLSADFTHTALYIELETRCGIRLTGGREDITAVVPARADADLLGLDDRTAAFSIRRIGCMHSRPTELRHTLIRGDRFTVSARFSPSEGYTFVAAGPQATR